MTSNCRVIRPDARSRGFQRAVVVAALAAQGCGSNPATPSSTDATIVIGPSGVAPAEVHIKAWEHVLFVNNDVRPHTIASDPFELHSDCPGINQVGYLSPGASRETGALNVPRVCGFHDHSNEFDSTLRGRIVVE